MGVVDPRPDRPRPQRLCTSGYLRAHQGKVSSRIARDNFELAARAATTDRATGVCFSRTRSKEKAAHSGLLNSIPMIDQTLAGCRWIAPHVSCRREESRHCVKPVDTIATDDVPMLGMPVPQPCRAAPPAIPHPPHNPPPRRGLGTAATGPSERKPAVVNGRPSVNFPRPAVEPASVNRRAPCVTSSYD